MTVSSVVGKEAGEGLESLVEHLQDGPLRSLFLLHGRAESVLTEPLSGEDLIEELESLVSLMLSAMVRFQTFNTELQRLVDLLARQLGEQPTEEPRDPFRLS